MLIKKKELLRLRVVTAKGFHIGGIFDIVFDTESQGVIQYEVHSSWINLKLTPLPSRATYIVHREQVISISDKEMIVQDGAVLEIEEHERKFLEMQKRINGAIQPEPTIRG